MGMAEIERSLGTLEGTLNQFIKRYEERSDGVDAKLDEVKDDFFDSEQQSNATPGLLQRLRLWPSRLRQSGLGLLLSLLGSSKGR